MGEIRELIAACSTDGWRSGNPFSPEIREAHEAMFASGVSSATQAEVLRKWLQRFQPCIFGRIAAANNLLSICVLTDDDLERRDHEIQDRIQLARTGWTRRAFDGEQSGFIVIAVSERLAGAEPNDQLRELAIRLAELYLLEPVAPDTIYLEDVFLEKPGPGRITWKWSAGVNYFAANGDGRWWQDHRIPGGIAFSVNSVGHMVRATQIAGKMVELNTAVHADDERWMPTKVDSLGKALEYAMRTIANAADTAWGKATSLLRSDESEPGRPACPIKLPAALSGTNYCEYSGKYHTDITVPSEYFVPRSGPSEDRKEHRLDFTYLFHRDPMNPDHVTMGEGRRIRTDAGQDVESAAGGRTDRLPKMWEEEERVDNCPRLLNALKGS